MLSRMPILAALTVGLTSCADNLPRRLDAELARYNRYVSHQWGDSIAAMYAPDGELLGPMTDPIRGPAAIRTYLSSFTGIRVDSSAMWADSVVIADSGAVQWGGYFQIATPGGQTPVTARGHLRMWWQKQPDGRWLLRRLEDLGPAVER